VLNTEDDDDSDDDDDDNDGDGDKVHYETGRFTVLICTSHRENNIMAKCFHQFRPSSVQPLV